MRTTTLLVVLWICSMVAIAVVPLHATRYNYVYDTADILDPSEEDTIETYCAQVDINTTAEIVIYTLRNLGAFGGDIDTARVEIFNDTPLDGVTGIGKREKDNGLLIVVSMDEKKWGIEVGYGLEGNVTDGEAGRIGRDIIVPAFKEERYFDGLFGAAKALGAEIGATSDVHLNPEDGDDDTGALLVLLIAFGLICVAVVVLYVASHGSGDWSSSDSSSSYGSSSGGGGGGGGGGGSGGGGASGGWG